MKRAERIRIDRKSAGRIIAKQGGFSLLEVVLAVTLMAMGMALALATFRGSAQSVIRAEAEGERNERLRAVQGFLRRQLSAALPSAFEFDQTTGDGTQFRGDHQRVEFVGTLPGYLSRGGSYLQTLEVVPGSGGKRLQFEFRLLSADGPIEAEREPEILLDGIAEARFEYRTLQADGTPGDWQDEWNVASQMAPVLRLQLRFKDDKRHWPELVVPVRLATVNTAAQTLTGDAASFGTNPPGRVER